MNNKRGINMKSGFSVTIERNHKLAWKYFGSDFDSPFL